MQRHPSNKAKSGPPPDRPPSPAPPPPPRWRSWLLPIGLLLSPDLGDAVLCTHGELIGQLLVALVCVIGALACLYSLGHIAMIVASQQST